MTDKPGDKPLCPCRCMPARLCPAPQDAGRTCPCHPRKRGAGHKGSDELLHVVDQRRGGRPPVETIEAERAKRADLFPPLSASAAR